MKKILANEFVYQIFALLLAVIVVHTIYVGVIRPNADAILEQQAEQEAQGGAYVPSRSLYVVVKDYEQETCFILMLWAMAIMAFKAKNILRQRALLQKRLLTISPGMSILPEDAREHSRSLQALRGTRQPVTARTVNCFTKIWLNPQHSGRGHNHQGNLRK